MCIATDAAQHRPAVRVLLLSACLGTTTPLHAVSMSIDSGASGASARDIALVREQPIEAQYLHLDADVTAGTIGSEVTSPPGALDEALQRAGEGEAYALGAANAELADAVIPDLSLHASPLVDSNSRDSGPSVMEVLRSVVTVTGGPAATHPARAGSPGRGGDSMLGLLQPLAMDLLEMGLTDRRAIDGTMVFSIMGRGAFVVEAARDGSGLMLSELRSGFDIVFGRDPTLRRPSASSHTAWEPDQPELAPAHWRQASGDDSSLRWAMDSTLGLFHGLVRAAIWAATTPLVLAIAVPVLLVFMLLGAVRRAREIPQQVVELKPVEAATNPSTDADARRRRRRRQSRRRGGWSMLVRQLRESIGFPDADTLRDSDFTAPRGRRERSAPKSA